MESSSKKKKVLIGVICGATVLIVALIILLIANIYKTQTFSTPSNLKVVQTSFGKTYVNVDENDMAKIYRFEIIDTSTQNKNIFDATTYHFDATSLLSSPSTYSITCQYVDANQKTSPKSEKYTFKSTQKIATPTLELGTNENSNKLFVETSNNFGKDVNLKFTLIFIAGNSIQQNSIFNVDFNDANGYVRGYFDLSAIFATATAGTQYSLAVQVSQSLFGSEEEYYTPSNISEQVLYEIPLNN